MTPDDLRDKDAWQVMENLFDVDPEDAYWWRLNKISEKKFQWIDKRLHLDFNVSNGFIVGLHEVSNFSAANIFAERNKIALLKSGGLFKRGVAEVLILCSGGLQSERIDDESKLYRIKTDDNYIGEIGPYSMLFKRLVVNPAKEEITNFPDAGTLYSLVIQDIEKENIPNISDAFLYLFRKHFRGIKFALAPITDLSIINRLEDGGEETEDPCEIQVGQILKPEALVLYNRAVESDPVAGFLYFYRVIETIYDDVIVRRLEKLRMNVGIDVQDLYAKIKEILYEKEDKWALRKVLESVVSNSHLEKAVDKGLFEEKTVKSLRDAVYKRRNSIAHGRLNKNEDILIPYIVIEKDSHKDRQWYELMREIADLLIDEWVIR